MELNQEELSALISEVSRLKSEMERQFLQSEDKWIIKIKHIFLFSIFLLILITLVIVGSLFLIA